MIYPEDKFRIIKKDSEEIADLKKITIIPNDHVMTILDTAKVSSIGFIDLKTSSMSVIFRKWENDQYFSEKLNNKQTISFNPNDEYHGFFLVGMLKEFDLFINSPIGKGLE
eukprot:CAMPEP_0114590702 /NCGR_PEP_ID=MMETSP0125-20121206/12913_1 /TAXON_ID=485358 ORGANISM="Aristerostoma sp., Strain ATCC 50986" /NCGR_SAMPLE_ID=MMETSP0125 /ASSEMBLY_ACC=CAM_ASM_000245 /LENGTH=110 /DNA_ID=CAMNT_0001788379 /DNA_START=1443 /DNA_END=1775 /DNA_ORIENTATION=-